MAWREEEYVDLAVRNAADAGNLERLRAGLREQVTATPLFNADIFAQQLEHALLSIWQDRPIVSPLQRSVLTADTGAI